MEGGSDHDNSLKRWAAKIGGKSGVCCALAVGGEVLGLVGVDNRTRARFFTPQEQYALQSAAEIIGIFLRNKRVEQQKENYSIAMQTVLDNVSTASYVIDPKDYHLVYLNRATSEKYPDAGVGQACYRCFRNLEKPCEGCPMERLEEQMQAIQSKEFYEAKHDRWIEASAGWVRWPDGEKYCMINCIDITKYK